MCRTIPSFPSLKVMEQARISGEASVRVFDAAVEKVFKGKKKISWMEVYAGEKAFKKFNNWLPDETVDAFKHFLVGIKGPLTTPVGGGIRSLNVALRQMLDLYVCLRPVQIFHGRSFAREAAGKGGHGDLPREHGRHLCRHRIRGGHARSAEDSRLHCAKNFPRTSRKSVSARRKRRPHGQRLEECPTRTCRVEVGVGIKPVSQTGTGPADHAAIDYAITAQAQERDAGA